MTDRLALATAYAKPDAPAPFGAPIATNPTEKTGIVKGFCSLAAFAVTWDVISMGGLLFIAAHQQAPPVGSFTSSHTLWIGVLVGLLAAALFGSGWITTLLFIVAVIGSGVITALAGAAPGHHVSFATVLWLLALLLVALVSLHLGRLRGLRHLGEHEFQVRRGYIRGISRFLAQIIYADQWAGMHLRADSACA